MKFKKFLKILKQVIFLDCTLGFGGHSEALLKNHPDLKFIACDQDQQALEFSKKTSQRFSQ